MKKPQFLSAALGPNLYLELTEELHAIGENDSIRFSCLPDVGLASQRNGLSFEDLVFLVRVLAQDIFEQTTAEGLRINQRWQECVAAMMRGYYCALSPPNLAAG